MYRPLVDTITEVLLVRVRELRPLAEQGNANAQFFLGFMYGNGEGVFQDYAKAVKWFRKAAEQGDGEAQYTAQYNLGIMYDKGQGVPQDYAKAVGWYRKAAEHGVANAQFSVGVMYRKGLGVPQDDAEAVREITKTGAHPSRKSAVSLRGAKRAAIDIAP